MCTNCRQSTYCRNLFALIWYHALLTTSNRINDDVLYHLKSTNDPIVDLNTGIVFTHVGMYIHRTQNQQTVAYLPIDTTECTLLNPNYVDTGICSSTNTSRARRFGGIDLWFRGCSLVRKGAEIFRTNQNSEQINRVAQQARNNQISSTNNSKQIFVLSDETLELAHEVETMQTELIELEKQLHDGYLNDKVRTLILQMIVKIKRLNSNLLIKSINNIKDFDFNVDVLMPDQQIALYKQLYTRIRTTRFEYLNYRQILLYSDQVT
ncbi:unnamed protein product [Didymodactylos carnosus]|uniref:Uncharacterized protein n=1 Tax=Didymodactylos carnosus TaxID=1234261 RepID=A0A8S2HAU5_9BILA|nr:unnamed protein product [Didymodactylos carnosus]CAF3623668.1 unnamed protein product [Didymodactylos carnosus]